jgi:hypothetical protein
MTYLAFKSSAAKGCVTAHFGETACYRWWLTNPLWVWKRIRQPKKKGYARTKKMPGLFRV